MGQEGPNREEVVVVAAAVVGGLWPIQHLPATAMWCCYNCHCIFQDVSSTCWTTFPIQLQWFKVRWVTKLGDSCPCTQRKAKSRHGSAFYFFILYSMIQHRSQSVESNVKKRKKEKKEKLYFVTFDCLNFLGEWDVSTARGNIRSFIANFIKHTNSTLWMLRRKKKCCILNLS